MLSGPVDWLPLAASGPLQPPVAAQDVALVDVQVSVELAPAATLAGDADSVTVGAAAGAVMPTVAVAALLLPPAPEQVME